LPAEPVRFSDEDARLLLKQASLRCTAARIAVLQRVADSPRPLSHAEVTTQLSEFGFDQSTIYRALHELAEQGTLSRLDLGDDVKRFELRREEAAQEAGEHPHFLCVDCGKIVCLPTEAFKIDRGQFPSKTVAAITQVVVRGHCDACT
jgi:Fur family ferric uptake transcriptional regulator